MSLKAIHALKIGCPEELRVYHSRTVLSNGLSVDVLIETEDDAEHILSQLSKQKVGTRSAPQSLQWKDALYVHICPLSPEHPARELGRVAEYNVWGTLCTGMNVSVVSSVGINDALAQLERQAKYKKSRVTRCDFKRL